MTAVLPITGTFLDEVTHDIPAHNWGEEGWDREFAHYAAEGLDTVILIRSGFGGRLSHPSKALRPLIHDPLPVYADMPELFLTLADKHGLKFFFGLYDSGYHWMRNDWRAELDINLAYLPEVWARYGHHPSFKGWYLPHETADTSCRIIDLNVALAKACKQTADLPVLSSPFYSARGVAGGYAPASVPRSPAEHARQWEEIFTAYSGVVDIAAFQDGTSPEPALRDNLAATAELAARHGIELWTNVESFDRDMAIKFPPIEWRKLVNKLTIASEFVSKAITFDYPHFLSPHSMWPSGRELHARYAEYLGGRYPELEA